MANGTYTTILVNTDRFSRGLRLVSLLALPSALETAEQLFAHIFHHYGIPEDIVRDHGPQFTSRVWSSFLEKFESPLASHPDIIPNPMVKWTELTRK